MPSSVIPVLPAIYSSSFGCQERYARRTASRGTVVGYDNNTEKVWLACPSPALRARPKSSPFCSVVCSISCFKTAVRLLNNGNRIINFAGMEQPLLQQVSWPVWSCFLWLSIVTSYGKGFERNYSAVLARERDKPSSFFDY